VPRGRPREFDVDQALDCALKVFWRKGYEGASLPDLTTAMGISRPSLYAAFGNKETLFRRAVERYSAGPAAYVRAAIEAPTAREVAQRLLNGAVELFTSPNNPAGCLLVQAALSCGEETDSLRKELAARRAANEALIRKRFQRAKAERDLPRDANAADLARYVVTVIRGMAVQSAGGAGRRELKSIAQTAMRAWPA